MGHGSGPQRLRFAVNPRLAGRGAGTQCLCRQELKHDPARHHGHRGATLSLSRR